MSYSAGFDWGSIDHAVCVIDDRGQVVLQAKVRHDAHGLAAMLRRLAQIAPAAELPIAIERPSGVVVETLLAAGHPLCRSTPTSLKPVDPATAPPAANTIPQTPICWPMCYAPTHIGSAA